MEEVFTNDDPILPLALRKVKVKNLCREDGRLAGESEKGEFEAVRSSLFSPFYLNLSLSVLCLASAVSFFLINPLGISTIALTLGLGAYLKWEVDGLKTVLPAQMLLTAVLLGVSLVRGDCSAAVGGTLGAIGSVLLYPFLSLLFKKGEVYRIVKAKGKKVEERYSLFVF